MKEAVAIGLVWLAFAGTAAAQDKASFEVAVVRQSQPGGAQHMGRTADGYRMTNLPLLVAILSAYVPTGGSDGAYFTNDRVKGAPDWARSERYDIDAKVAEGELAAWHAPATQKTLLQEKLRTLLAERCKLAVHRETQEIAVYALVVGKNGPKLADAKPIEPHAGGVPMPGDAVIVPARGDRPLMFYNATMVTLAQLLSNYAGRPVQDKTGLTGRYDFSFDGGAMAPPPPPSPDGTPTPDPRPSLFSVIQPLGLRLEPVKSQVETLVIDHMEHPVKQ
jgi:uncharacterized protein (TIGR03435 family)